MDNMPLEAGDDAGKVKWVDISEKLKLYANHSHFIKLVAEKRGAHWMEEPVTDCQKWWFWKPKQIFEGKDHSTSFKEREVIFYMFPSLVFSTNNKLLRKQK